jgi:hypothetical protein
MPENTLATAVLVVGSRAYRVDALAENPWLVRPGPLYLLEYADEVDALPWPEGPVEISFDTTSTVALAPMPERWRRSDGEDWPESAGCDVDCDPWAPGRWTARGLVLRRCPQLQVTGTSTSGGRNAARWDDEKVVQPEPNAVLRLVGFGKPDRVSRSIDNSLYPSAVRLGDTSALVWRRWASTGSTIVDERSFTAGVAGRVSVTVPEDLVDILEPVDDMRSKVWLVTGLIDNARVGIYEMQRRALECREAWSTKLRAGRASSPPTSAMSSWGRMTPSPSKAVDPRASRQWLASRWWRRSKASACSPRGATLIKDAFGTAVMLRYDVASASWRPYAALPGVSSIVTMVPHEGGVLFGTAEGVGYYSRNTGACTITATLKDVTQLIAMPDGTHYVRAGYGPDSTVGWLVP